MRRLLLLLIGLALIPAPSQAQPDGADLLVLAFYYSWYGEADWNSPAMPDLPVQTYPYGDPAAIEQHVIEAKAAGLDGLVMSWYGPERGDPTDAHFRYLLAAAAKHDLKVAVDFDMGGGNSQSVEALTLNLRFLYANYLNHPNYLTYDGRPVIFFWKQGRFVGRPQWQELRAAFDPNHDAIWIAEGVEPDWVNDTFDGLHLYNIAWSNDPAGTLRIFRDATRSRGGIWVATAMPGWDDTRLDLPNRDAPFAINRAGGDYYRRTFAGARATQPDMLVITSYNEWLEGSYLASSQNYGDTYVNLTAELITDLRTETPIPSLAPGVSDATGQPSVNLRVRSGPGQGYRPIGRVTNDMVLPIVGRYENWLLVDYPGGRGWISYDFVQTLGDLETVPTTFVQIPANGRIPVADTFAPEVGFFAAGEAMLWDYPGSDLANPIRRMTVDEILPITGVYRGYYRTSEGWVLVDDIQLVNEAGTPNDLLFINRLIPEPDGIYAQAAAEVVIREFPDGTRIAAFPFNALAEAIGRTADSNWLQIRYAGVTGWVNRQFITPHGDINALPVR